MERIGDCLKFRDKVRAVLRQVVGKGLGLDTHTVVSTEAVSPQQTRAELRVHLRAVSGCRNPWGLT